MVGSISSPQLVSQPDPYPLSYNEADPFGSSLSRQPRRLDHGMGLVSTLRFHFASPLLLCDLFRHLARSPTNSRRRGVLDQVQEGLGDLQEVGSFEVSFRFLCHRLGRGPCSFGLREREDKGKPFSFDFTDSPPLSQDHSLYLLSILASL